MNAPPGEKRCSCSRLMYRNNGDASRDCKIIGKGGCPKCHGTGMVRKCDKCGGCGMLPGSAICGRCYGHGVLMGTPQEWTTSKVKKGE